MEKLEKKVSIIILIVVVVASLFLTLVGFISDFMWFKEMGYVSVFFTQLVTQLKVGIPTFLRGNRHEEAQPHNKLACSGFWRCCNGDECYEPLV